MPRKNVLIITYYWPPASSGAIWRFLKMSKYLPEFGWNPIILTVKDGAFSSQDFTLEEKISSDIKVFRAPTVDPYSIYNFLMGKKGKHIPEAMSGIVDSPSFFQKASLFIRLNFFIPDPKIGWVPYAFKKAKEIAKEYKIDAVITTGPPQSTHFIGAKLKKKLNIPWVLDFRDPWTNNYLITELSKRSFIANKIDQYFETKTIKKADAVTSISKGLISEFTDRAKLSKVIFNGFDEEDYIDIEATKAETFDILYIGSMKPNQNIKALWNALIELCNENSNFKKKLKLDFTGNINNKIINEISETTLKGNLAIQKFIPQSEAIGKMQKTSILLLIIPRSKYAKSTTSGKIFEYLASKTPILSIGPVDGDAAEILNNSDRDIMIDFDDKESIKKFVLSKFNKWSENNGILTKHTSDDYLRYSKRNATNELAQLLNSIS